MLCRVKKLLNIANQVFSSLNNDNKKKNLVRKVSWDNWAKLRKQVNHYYKYYCKWFHAQVKKQQQKNNNKKQNKKNNGFLRLARSSHA